MNHQGNVFFVFLVVCALLLLSIVVLPCCLRWYDNRDDRIDAQQEIKGKTIGKKENQSEF